MAAKGAQRGAMVEEGGSSDLVLVLVLALARIRWKEENGV